MDYLKDATQIRYILSACEALDLSLDESFKAARRVLDLTKARPYYTVWPAERDLPLKKMAKVKVLDMQTVMNVAHVLGFDCTSTGYNLVQ